MACKYLCWPWNNWDPYPCKEKSLTRFLKAKSRSGGIVTHRKLSNFHRDLSFEFLALGQILTTQDTFLVQPVKVYGIKPLVWGRVGPDPRAELQVDPARGPQAQGLGRPERDIGNTSLCVALPEQANSYSSDASYHGEQGYNNLLCPLRTHPIDPLWPMRNPCGITMGSLSGYGQGLDWTLGNFTPHPRWIWLSNFKIKKKGLVVYFTCPHPITLLRVWVHQIWNFGFSA